MSDPSSIRTHSHWRDCALLALLCAFLFFFRLGGNGIFDLDEGLYVGAAREMNLSGDFITPRVNGLPFFEKPPLIYWFSAASMRAFGTNEFAARLPSALATTLLAFLILGFGTRFLGRRAGMLAAVMFALSPIVFGEARQLTTDATLDLCIATALFCLFRGFFSESRRDSGRLYLGFWAACGFGVLAKGLPGILIPCTVGFIFFFLHGGNSLRSAARAVGRCRLIPGILLFLLIAAPWHYLAYRYSGDAFTQEYIIRQHLARFRGGDDAHRAPFWFYVPAFLVGMFPWSFFVPAAFGRGKAQQEAGTAEETFDTKYEIRNTSSHIATTRLFLTVWAVLVFVMFSLSGSKLVSYILPMYVPAALLVADWLVRSLDSNTSNRALVGSAVVMVLPSTALFVATLFHREIIRLIERSTHRAVNMDQISPEIVRFAIHLAGAASLAALCFLVLAGIRRTWAVPALVGVMVVFFGIAIFEGLPAIDAAFIAPIQSLAREGGRLANESGRKLVISSKPRRPSALFQAPDALLPIAGRETRVPEVYPDDLPKSLQQYEPAYLLIDANHAASFKGRQWTRVLREDKGWVLLDVP